MTGKVWAFNTGRLYTVAGQRIAATFAADGAFYFVDLDRGLDGYLPAGTIAPASVQTSSDVLRVYDYVWSTSGQGRGIPWADDARAIREQLTVAAGNVPPVARS